MSWSVSKVMGSVDKVRPVAASAFDNAARSYEGKTEANDVLAAKAAVMSFLDEAKCAEGQGVVVEANGSRGESWVSVSITCNKIALLI